MKITPKNLFSEKADVWRVNEVKIEDVDAAIDDWEAKLDFLEEHSGYTMDEEDRVHGLLEIVPTEMRVKLLEEQEKGKYVDYDDLKEEILYRVETHCENKGGKKLGWVGKEDVEDEENPDVWTDEQWGAYIGQCVNTAYEQGEGYGTWTDEQWNNYMGQCINAAYNPSKGAGKGTGKSKGKGSDKLGKGQGKTPKGGGKGDKGKDNSKETRIPKGSGKGKGNDERVTGTFSGKIEFDGLCYRCGGKGHRARECMEQLAVAPQNGAPQSNKRQRTDNPIAAALKDRAEAAMAQPQQVAAGVPAHVSQAVQQWQVNQSPTQRALGTVSWINVVEKVESASVGPRERAPIEEFIKPKRPVRAKRVSGVGSIEAKSHVDGSRFRQLDESPIPDEGDESEVEQVPVRPRVGAARRPKVRFAETRAPCGDICCCEAQGEGRETSRTEGVKVSIERRSDQELMGKSKEELWDPSRSDSESAPVTDEPARSPLEHEDANRHGTTAKPRVSRFSRGPAVEKSVKEVNCFSSPSSIGAATQAQKDGWIKMRVTVDSGAADSVASPDSFPGYTVIEHTSPQFFQSATGEPIVNMGEQLVAMVTEEGTLRGMKFQCTKKVRKPLASVKRMVEANHAVVFAPENLGGSFILNIETGEMNSLHESEGNYMLDV